MMVEEKQAASISSIDDAHKLNILSVPKWEWYNYYLTSCTSLICSYF